MSRIRIGAAMVVCSVFGAVVGGVVPSLGAGPGPRVVVPETALEEPGDLALTPITPQRFLDTRVGQVSLGTRHTPLGTVEAFTVDVAGIGEVPGDATAVVVNVTAVNASTSTFISVYPSDAERPTASLLNPAPGRTVANSGTVLLANGSFDIYNQNGTVDVIIDVMGYLTQDLTTSVASLRAGDVLVPPSGGGGGFMDETTKPDWMALDWHGDDLAAIIDSVQPSPGRYSTMRLEAVFNIDAVTTVEVCFRIASETTGPVTESEVCASDTDTPYLTRDDGTRYYVIYGPVVPVEEGRLYLQAKVIGDPSPAVTSNVNVDHTAFRMYG